MSNALEAASLIMVPSGYEDGTLASVKPNDGTGDFTFSRGSNLSATRINEQGYIEKGYENLLLQSNSFDTTWNKNGVTIESGYDGYDGTNDAWLLTKLNISNRIEQSISGSGVTTFSAYFKAGTLNWAILNIGGVGQYFDLQNGILGTTTGIGSYRIDFGIESVGNGWYRGYATTDQSYSIVRIYPANDDGNNTGPSGNIYIQDAMLNQGLVAYPYIETTTAPVAGGILEDMPRLDWASGAPSLLLEPSRTNLITQSEYLSGYTFTNSSIETNAATSPEGLLNASKLIENTSTGEHRILNSAISTSSGVDYTYSFFVKANGRNKLRFYSFQFNNLTAIFDFAANNVISITGGTSPSITSESYGSGWYRVKISDTATAINLGLSAMLVKDDNSFNYTGDGTSGVFLYGYQVEAGYETSYIPTYGVSQTRLVDVCYKTGLSSYIGQNDGTLFIEWEQKLSDDVYAMFGLNDGLNNNRVNLVLNQSGNSRLGLVYRVNSVSHYSNVNIQSLNVGTIYKAAIVYTQTTLKMYLNGTIVVNETGFSASGGTLNELNFKLQSSGSSFIFTMPTNQTLVFPTALTDSECIQLTTI